MLQGKRNLHHQNALPILLIGLGLLWFVWNISVLPMQGWRSLWYFAPLALVVPGTELLVTGRVSWRVLVVALLFVAVVVVAGAFFVFVPSGVSGLR